MLFQKVETKVVVKFSEDTLAMGRKNKKKSPEKFRKSPLSRF